ncbi:hypothetical protein Tco_0736374 [Tanacetum coccineum]
MPSLIFVLFGAEELFGDAVSSLTCNIRGRRFLYVALEVALRYEGREEDATYLMKKVIYYVESRQENGGVLGQSRTSLCSLKGKQKVKESRFIYCILLKLIEMAEVAVITYGPEEEYNI